VMPAVAVDGEERDEREGEERVEEGGAAGAGARGVAVAAGHGGLESRVCLSRLIRRTGGVDGVARLCLLSVILAVIDGDNDSVWRPEDR
jgi:hypothetical protein